MRLLMLAAANESATQGRTPKDARVVENERAILDQEETDRQTVERMARMQAEIDAAIDAMIEKVPGIRDDPRIVKIIGSRAKRDEPGSSSTISGGG